MCCPQAFYAMASCCNAAKLISSWFPVQGCASPPNCFAASAISRAVLVIRSHSERQQREIGPQQAGNDGSRFEIGTHGTSPSGEMLTMPEPGCLRCVLDHNRSLFSYLDPDARMLSMPACKLPPRSPDSWEISWD